MKKGLHIPKHLSAYCFGFTVHNFQTQEANNSTEKFLPNNTQWNSEWLAVGHVDDLDAKETGIFLNTELQREPMLDLHQPGGQTRLRMMLMSLCSC